MQHKKEYKDLTNQRPFYFIMFSVSSVDLSGAITHLWVMQVSVSSCTSSLLSACFNDFSNQESHRRVKYRRTKFSLFIER